VPVELVLRELGCLGLEVDLAQVVSGGAIVDLAKADEQAGAVAMGADNRQRPVVTLAIEDAADGKAIRIVRQDLDADGSAQAMDPTTSRSVNAAPSARSDDLERDRLPFARGDDLEQRAQRLGHASVAADDLAHVVFSDMKLDHAAVLLVHRLDRNGLGVVDQ
jgi:hypothetical protein